MEGDSLRVRRCGEPSVASSISPPANIQSLPREMLVHILSHLSPTELCNTVPRVCTLWEELHRDPKLYRVLRFGEDDSKETVKKCMELATSLQSFTLAVDGSSDMLRKLRLCNVNKSIGKQLRYLSLTLTLLYFGESNSLSKMVIEFLKKCSNLHTLHLEGVGEIPSEMLSHFTDLSDPTLNPLISNLRTLRVMCLDEDAWSIWINLATRCVQLEEIVMYTEEDHDFSFPTIQLTRLCDRLCGTLRVLHVDYGYGDGWSPEALGSLSKCLRLQELCFAHADHLSDEGLVVIGSLSGLRKLEIKDCCKATEDGWASMISSPALKSLESFVLDDCSFTSQTVVAVGANLSNLKLLSLQRFKCVAFAARKKKLTSPGGFRSLMGCPKLEELSLSDLNPVSSSEILLVSTFLPRLQKLAIYKDRNFKRSVIDVVKEKMPFLIVIQQ